MGKAETQDRDPGEEEKAEKMSDEKSPELPHHIELDPDHEDPVVRAGNRLIRHGVRLMSIIMVVVIFFAILDTGYIFYQRLLTPPILILNISDLLTVFSAALVVLIAIEIYSNVALYLTANVIHVKLVVATALMAVARKVITLDDKSLDATYFLGYAGLGLAFGITYWLLSEGK